MWKGQQTCIIHAGFSIPIIWRNMVKLQMAITIEIETQNFFKFILIVGLTNVLWKQYQHFYKNSVWFVVYSFWDKIKINVKF